jgi:mannosyltransferase
LTITWVAFLIRTVNLTTQSLWRDEVDAIRFSSWSSAELVAGLFRAGHNGPLFFLLLRPWRSLASDSEFALRYPSALMGTVAVPLGFVLARQLGLSRAAGLLLGGLLATSPYLVWYGQEAKMYTLLLVLMALAFIAYLKALTGAKLFAPLQEKDHRWGWWIIFVAATTLAYYTHILSPLMLIVYPIVAGLYYAHWRRHWRGWLISLSCLTLPYIPLALWQIPLLLNEDFQSGHPFYPLQQEIFLLLQLYSSGLVRFAPIDLFASAAAPPDDLVRYLGAGLELSRPFVGLMPIILFVFLFLCSLFLGPGNRLNMNMRLTLAVWALLPPLVVYLISLRVPVFEDRYLIYITPAFYLLIVIGLMLVSQYSRWLAGLCFVLILAVNLEGIWQQQRQPIKADFRAAAEYRIRLQPL